MDRRRRALGLKKPLTCKTERPTTSTADVEQTRPTNVLATNANSRGDKVLSRCQMKTPQSNSLRRHNSTPPTRTPKSVNKSDMLQSPNSPLYSPPAFHRYLGSPEEEVSWDWSCSQVPKDIVLPTNRSLKRIKSLPSPTPAPIISQWPRKPPDHRLSEEENKKRLERYKSILSQPLKRNTQKEPEDLENNNVKKEIFQVVHPITTTPNHRPKPIVKDKEDNNKFNDLFDDSANDFMFECSQAIEEKLKTGNYDEALDTELVVNIGLPPGKHALCPLPEETVRKRVCHGRNLFPENPNSENNIQNPDRHLRLEPPHKKIKNEAICENIPNNNKTVMNDLDQDFTTMCTQPNQLLENGDKPKIKSSAGLNQHTSSTAQDTNITTDVTKALDILVNGHSSTVTVNNKPLNIDKGLDKVNIFRQGAPNSSNSKILQSTCMKNMPIQEKKQSTSTSVHHKTSSISNNMRKPNTNTRNDSLHSKSLIPPTKPSTICIPNNTTIQGETNMNRPTIPCGSNHATVMAQNYTVANNVKPFVLGSTKMSSNQQGSNGQTKTADVIALLDDSGLDSELSSLDFDSLCSDSVFNQQSNSRSEIHPEVKVSSRQDVQPPAKVCSREEIEAKRLAALKKLKQIQLSDRPSNCSQQNIQPSANKFPEINPTSKVCSRKEIEAKRLAALQKLEQKKQKLKIQRNR